MPPKRGRSRTDGGVVIEPDKPSKPTPTPNTPVAPTPKPTPRSGTYGTYNKKMDQDSGAGGTYGRPVTSTTTIKLYNNKTGKLVSSKSTQQTQTYKGGKYAPEKK
jgi:hypothetical protein